MLRARIRAVHDEHASPQNQNGRRPRDTQQATDDGAVFPRPRIVVVAVQKQLVRDTADFVLRCLYQSQTQIFGWKLHSIKILRDVTLGSQHNDGGGVSVLLSLLVPLKLEADRL